MKNKKYCVAIAFASFLIMSNAVIVNGDPGEIIDIKLESCMDNSTSTQDVVRCYDKAFLLWDAALNKEYKDIADNINKINKFGVDINNIKTAKDNIINAIKKSQQKWIIYKNSEDLYLNKYYGSLRGSRYEIENIERKVGIVKTRVNELKKYNDSIKDYIARQ